MLTVFDFEGHEVRFVGTADNPEWVAKDVCECLSLGNTSQALSTLEDSDKGITKVDTPSGEQEMLTVTESGLYTLVFKSRKDEAKRFKRWVFEEVLPSIRKTGLYNAIPFKLSDDSAIVSFESDDYWTTSTKIAEIFEKQHKNVLRDLEEAKKDWLKFELMSQNLPNFKIIDSTYLDKYGRATKRYKINRALFNYVVLAYQGDNAKLYRMMFIKAFEDLEKKMKVYLAQQLIFKNKKRQQVYVLRNTATDMVKIGVTNSIERRLAELQNASGCEIVVEFLSLKSDNAQKIEKKLHQHFKEKRGLGEWFSISHQEVIEVLKQENLIINPNIEAELM